MLLSIYTLSMEQNPSFCIPVHILILDLKLAYTVRHTAEQDDPSCAAKSSVTVRLVICHAMVDNIARPPGF